MRTNTTECLFTVEVSGAFNGVEKISWYRCYSRRPATAIPWRPQLGQWSRGAKPGDLVVVEGWGGPLTGVARIRRFRVSRFSQASQSNQGCRKVKSASAGIKGAPLLDHATGVCGDDIPAA
jgi:hypothetical protein